MPQSAVVIAMCNCDITPVLFCGEEWGSILAVGMPFVSARAKMTHQAQLHRWYCVTIFVLVGGAPEANGSCSVCQSVCVSVCLLHLHVFLCNG